MKRPSSPSEAPAGSARLARALRAARDDGRKAMGLFLTCGFPNRAATVALLRTLDDAGADFLELGMPFSDPLAEGLPIQRASARALAEGTTLQDALEAAGGFRSGSDTPLYLMGYVNPIVRYGAERFCRDAADAGVDGLIIPDLPLEELGLLAPPARAARLDVVQLVAPTSPDDRIRRLDAATGGFLYAVSMAGLTGTRLDEAGVGAYLSRVAALASHPVMVGFGIRSSEQARRLAAPVDGFIVGSALLDAIGDAWADPNRSDPERHADISAFVRRLAPAPGDATNPPSQARST